MVTDTPAVLWNRHRQVLSLWDRKLLEILDDSEIQGSPERSLSRTLVRDSGRELFVLEAIEPCQAERKRAIAARMEVLAARGLPVAPPLRGADCEHVQNYDGRAWQLTPFLPGVPLDRGRFWREAWRGEALARFVAELPVAGQDLSGDATPFELAGYVERIGCEAQAHDPDVHKPLEQVFAYLDEHLAPTLAMLPMGFAHGDPHPMNVIWAEDHIRAVIDWEFCGPKPWLYDAALVLGCVGSESTEARKGPFAKAFVSTLEGLGLLPPGQKAVLPVLTLALRVPWMAEWLRRRDREMIDFERFYMSILLQEVYSGGV
jgi:homoserine kinase type II